MVLGRIADRGTRSRVLVPPLAEDQDFSLCRLQEIERDFEQGGFATAVRAYQAKHTASRDGEVDFPQDNLPPSLQPDIP